MTQLTPAGDFAVVNARVRTMDPHRPSAEAVAWRNGRIVAVGSSADVRGVVAPGAEVIDAGGRTVTPGLIDSHMHPVWGAELTNGVDLEGATTLDAVRAALRTEADRVGERGGWIRGWNLDYAAFDGIAISGAAIEDAVYGLPTALTFYDLHTAVGTRAALELASITGSRRFPDASSIVVDESGAPTGELREPTAYNLLLDAAPAPTPAEVHDLVTAVLARMNRCGVTGGVVMDGSPDTLRLLRGLEDTGQLPLRLTVALWHGPDRDDDGIDEFLALRTTAGRRWRSGLIKLFSDGVIDTGTAWLYEADTCGHGLDSFWPDPNRYLEVVARYARAGFQIATHAVGDRAVGAVLDAYDKVGPIAVNGAPHRIEHLETVSDDDLARMGALGVTASMQPLHMQWRQGDGSDSWTARLGPERAAHAFRTRDMLQAGVPVTLGSDWPVAQLDPRVGMAWARLRRMPGQPDAPAFEPHQRLTAEEALLGYTSWAARAIGEPDRGRIACGAVADLACFGADPIFADADDLPGLPVSLTVVDGEIVHREELS